MKDLLPNPADREELITLMLLGEILTRRGSIGPLRRLWIPVGKRAPDREVPRRVSVDREPEKTE